MKKTYSILLVPFDPVHDLGIRMINMRLSEQGHNTVVLPPDLPVEEIVKKASEKPYDYILISRTMGYNVAELLARLVDQFDAAGIRERSKIIIGGKAVTPEMAAELGFDMGFTERCTVEEAVAYIEGRPLTSGVRKEKDKENITAKYSYEFKNSLIKNLLDSITEQILSWAEDKTSPGVRRAELRKEMFDNPNKNEKLLKEYLALCDEAIVNAYTKEEMIPGTRKISNEEIENLEKIKPANLTRPIQHLSSQPKVIIFTGSGCPIMDIVHNYIAAECGIDGSIFICPSWVARMEGLLQGLISHEEDGTIPTFDNIAFVKKHLREGLYFQVRAHRGLNTAETALYASQAKADFSKINPVYGSINAGTDPARLTIDAIHAIKIMAQTGVAYDIPANDELSGIPTFKNFAGMLIVAALGLKLGARPILKPLFCFAPYAMLYGQMNNNFVDYNAAKIFALRSIIDAPIWAGEPIAFLTQTTDRSQSATITALHAGLAASLPVDMITFASTDEAYSRGAITIASRIDTCNSLRTVFRFLGDAKITPSQKSKEYTNHLIDGITKVLTKVKERESFVDSLYEGDFGTREEGGNPGRAGRGTVIRNVI